MSMYDDRDQLLPNRSSNRIRYYLHKCYIFRPDPFPLCTSPLISSLTISSPAPGVEHRMHSIARSRLVRDVILVFVGAVSMHFVTTLLHPFDDLYPTWTLQSYHQEEIVIDRPTYDQRVDNDRDDKSNPLFDSWSRKGDGPLSSPDTAVTPSNVLTNIPETELVQHAPGWTVFKNLYMSGGTFYVVSDKPRSEFPELLYILSVPIPALNTPENIQARLPTDQEMDFISTREAQRRWGPTRPGETNRIQSVVGNTVSPHLSNFLSFSARGPFARASVFPEFHFGFLWRLRV